MTIQAWLLGTLLVLARAAGAQQLPDLGGPGGVLAPEKPGRAVTVRASLEPLRQAPGHPVVAVVTVDCPQGWYIYADSLTVSVGSSPDSPALLAVERLYLPPAKQKYDRVLKETVQYLDGRFEVKLLLRVRADAAPGEHTIGLVPRYQACAVNVCYPGADARVPVTLTVLEPGAPPVAVVLPSEPVAPAPAFSAGGAEDEFVKAGFIGSVLLAFLAGLGLTLTPCVYPMIPITVSVIGAATTGRRMSAFARSLLYVLGISTTYAALGIAAAATGRAFGTVLQHPAVYIGLAVVFVVMAGAMFDLYQIRIPGTWAARLQGAVHGRWGLLGVFLIGVLSGVAVTPCSAPVVFAAMGYVAKTHNLLAGFLIFFAIAWGMGLPLVVLGTFGGLVRSLPKSGEWQQAVKHIFGLALLGAALYFVGMSGSLSKFSFAITASVAAGATGLIGLARGKRLGWRRGWGLALSIAGLVLLASAPLCFFVLNAPRHVSSLSCLVWSAREEDAKAEAVRFHRPIMIFFRQERCPACQRMRREMFEDRAFQNERARFVALWFDGTDSGSPEVRAMLRRYGVVGFPTMVFVGDDGNVLRDKTVLGYADPATLVKIMQSIPDDPSTRHLAW